jgi:multiple sugar transport system substrate-binding protein
MINLRKVIACVMALLMMVSLAACGKPANGDPATTPDPGTGTNNQAAPNTQTNTNVAPAADTGKVLTIYCWNEEFKSRFEKYFQEAGKMPEGVTVNFVITPNQGNTYQNKLDADLLGQSMADEPIDIFLVEADYALKYCNSSVTLDVIKDVGLTEEDLAQQYEYTQKIVTDKNGALKGTSWQATPGTFIYRRSIAREVLGTDDPAQVQEMVGNWDKFDAVAAKMAAAGYKMLSGYDDAYRLFANNISQPWVDENGKIVIDPLMMEWVDKTKEYTDLGYNNKSYLWDSGGSGTWASDQGPEGKVFGVFHAPWGINFCMTGWALSDPDGPQEVGNGIWGDWAVCLGPQSFYWGGTWICAAAGTDNINLVRDVMKTLTCDKETMKAITLNEQDYTNNKAAMEEIANSDYASTFLGGQNHIKYLSEAASKISLDTLSPYDQGMTEQFQNAFHDYFNGNISKEEALENFYTAILELYPNLSR